MTSRALLNIGLAIAVVMAALFLYVRKPGDAPAREERLLVPVPQAEIESVEIERSNSPAIKLRRENAQWRMTAPVAARLDETTLARVLELSRVAATNELAADDLARYGLDKPWARVRFNTHTLEFGNTNTVTEEFYVRSGKAVHAIQARHASAIPSAAAKLIAHRMLAADDAIAGIAFAEFAVRHDGTRWQMTPADPGLSQDDLVRWIDQWRYASSIVTQPGDAPGKTDAAIELRDGRRIEVAVKARTPDLVLHRRDEGLDYHFNARLASTLLSSPAAATNQAR